MQILIAAAQDDVYRCAFCDFVTLPDDECKLEHECDTTRAEDGDATSIPTGRRVYETCHSYIAMARRYADGDDPWEVRILVPLDWVPPEDPLGALF